MIANLISLGFFHCILVVEYRSCVFLSQNDAYLDHFFLSLFRFPSVQDLHTNKGQYRLIELFGMLSVGTNMSLSASHP